MAPNAGDWSRTPSVNVVGWCSHRPYAAVGVLRSRGCNRLPHGCIVLTLHPLTVQTAGLLVGPRVSSPLGQRSLAGRAAGGGRTTIKLFVAHVPPVCSCCRGRRICGASDRHEGSRVVVQIAIVAHLYLLDPILFAWTAFRTLARIHCLATSMAAFEASRGDLA